MQILASKKVYMFFYGAIGIIKVSQNFRYSRNYVEVDRICSNSNIHIVVCFGLGGSPSSN